jgi:integrase
MPRTGYYFVSRPAGVSRHRIMVFDHNNRLHLHLSVFAEKALRRIALSSLRVYLYAILKFFTFLATDEVQVRAGRRWDSAPDAVRIAIEDYLNGRLACKITEHRLGFQLIKATAQTPHPISAFLSGTKLFYKVMKGHGYYPFDNPLVDGAASTLEAVLWELEGEAEYPRMPDHSGVQAPHHRRLTDSYFKLVGDEWVPEVIDDPHLFDTILSAGRTHGNWGLREICVTRLLFETGGRVSEITGLTLGDWMNRGLLQEASAFSKGSNGRRVKFVRFSMESAKLLRTYFNGERREFDPHGWTIEDYCRASKQKTLNLLNVPLFLTSRGTQFTPKLFREHYWRPACEAAGIDADIHQARHWYVTTAVRLIYQTTATEPERMERLEALIAYMGWYDGWNTIKSYEHVFTPARHAEIQEMLYANLSQAAREDAKDLSATTAEKGEVVLPAFTSSPADADFDFLRQIGG